MNHETCQDQLLELAYGELPRREAQDAEAHLAGCAACREALARIQGTRRAMAGLPPEPAPARGEGVLLAAAREAAERRRAEGPARLLPRWLWGGAVGAVAAAAVVALSWRVLELAPPREDDLSSQRGGGFVAERAEPAAPAAPPPQADVVGPAPAPAEGGRPPSAAIVSAPREPERREPERVRAAAKAAPAAKPAPAPPPAPAAAQEEAAEAMAAAPAAPEADAHAGIRARNERAAQAPATQQPFYRAPAPQTTPKVRVEERTFEDCPGERRRTLARDADGHVVGWSREGLAGDREVRVEARYDLDGELVEVRVTPPGAAIPVADAAALGVPARAADARLDAPPRCAGP